MTNKLYKQYADTHENIFGQNIGDYKTRFGRSLRDDLIEFSKYIPKRDRRQLIIRFLSKEDISLQKTGELVGISTANVRTREIRLYRAMTRWACNKRPNLHKDKFHKLYLLDKQTRPYNTKETLEEYEKLLGCKIEDAIEKNCERLTEIQTFILTERFVIIDKYPTKRLIAEHLKISIYELNKEEKEAIQIMMGQKEPKKICPYCDSQLINWRRR